MNTGFRLIPTETHLDAESLWAAAARRLGLTVAGVEEGGSGFDSVPKNALRARPEEDALGEE
jgi:hypothetical protein